MFVGSLAASFISPRRCVCVRWAGAGGGGIGCCMEGGGCVGGPVRTVGGAIGGMPGGCVRCDCVVTGGGAGARCCVVTGRACVVGDGARSPNSCDAGIGGCPPRPGGGGAAIGQFAYGFCGSTIFGADACPAGGAVGRGGGT